MKLELLAAGSQVCPLLRLWDFDRAQACVLRSAFNDLASDTRKSIDLLTLPDIFAVNGCRLVLNVGDSDVGIVAVSDRQFVCTLTPDTWSWLAELTAPFCHEEIGGGHFQWLWTSPSVDLPLLLSTSGTW